MTSATINEQYKSRKAQQKNLKILALFSGIALAFFIYGAMQYKALPVMQKNLDGDCMRVIDAKGKKILNGCETYQNSRLLYKSEYVAK